VKGDIEFRDVWFSYVPGEWVLQGVSFHVEPRQTVAFVGSTGSADVAELDVPLHLVQFDGIMGVGHLGLDVHDGKDLLVYMLYISSILCLFYLGGMGHLDHVSFLGQTISSGTIVTSAPAWPWRGSGSSGGTPPSSRPRGQRSG